MSDHVGAAERCTAEQIASCLAATAQPGSRVLLNDPLSDPPGLLRLVTDQLWSVELWRTGAGQLDRTLTARSPDGRTWQRGCQRQWLTTGEVIEPLDLLSQEQRQALHQRLSTAALWPEPDTDGAAPDLVLCERVKAKRRPARRRPF
jgi:hypothetical protein